MKRKLIIFIIMTLIILIFKNYQLVLSSTIDGVNIWFYKVFPYLFIMIIIQDLLINLDFANLFKRTSTYIFFMSIISGSPSNAYIISKLVKEEKITKEYGNTCLIFTFFTNPLFLYSILNIIFNSLYMTIKIMIIIYISNFIIYLYYKKDLPVANMYGKSSNINLPSSIKSSINTNLMVLGSIVFYFIISKFSLCLAFIYSIIFYVNIIKSRNSFYYFSLHTFLFHLISLKVP